MLMHSVYIIPCECGNEVRSETTVAVCLKCGREFVVENWGGFDMHSKAERTEWKQ